MEEEKTWKVVNVLFAVIYIGIIIFGTLVVMHLSILDTNEVKSFDKGYKSGQIDALNRIQNYGRVIQQDTIYFKIK